MHAADDSPQVARAPAFRAAGGLFDNRELSTIAMIAAIHFVVSFVARMAGTAIFGLLAGPFAVYLDGIGGEGIPCLLMAVIVTLIPRVGTATLTIATVWLLNGIVSGSFSVSGILLVGVSIVAHELILLLFGMTKMRREPTTLANANGWLVVRTALAVGIANALALYIQFAVTMRLYDLKFAPWYVDSVALWNGFVYGAIGAAIGTRWGFQLRKTAP
jgi:hypothetical protein